ncbi:ADP-ribose pyrophosphatase [[Clostridium] ultunense Esp]|uniref:NUDIX domain-containing protein n=1 Tax=Thermicanus aegyptius TaxID=94009 RepID=UPI0002B70743|nr:NUDIX hydrolase [Thermicanus aegyptius]CCQ95630.1 ADP-ribose pyrophosphatase [[Clostridium] ultunense Esp]
MSHFEEKTLHREEIYKGKVVELAVDQVLLPDGKRSTRELVFHPGAVAVLAVTKEGKFIFVEQFRKALERDLLEIPAGKLEPGEEPLTSAMRELEEETGYMADSWIFLSRFYTSPGFSNEVVHLFLAKGLKAGRHHLDDDEFVEVYELTEQEIFEEMARGRIADAKTILAVYHWALFQKKEGE